MRQEEFLVAYAKNFEVISEIDRTRSGEAMRITDYWHTHRKASWIFISIFVIAFLNMLYAIFELLTA